MNFQIIPNPFIIPKRLESILGSLGNIVNTIQFQKILNCYSSESLKEICNELNRMTRKGKFKLLSM